MNLKNKTICVYDYGPYNHLAERLARDTEVLYYVPWKSSFPTSDRAFIGAGKSPNGVKRIYDFWDIVRKKKADAFVFFDVYDADIQYQLIDMGFRVFGCLGSEKLELDRELWKREIEKVGLPVVPHDLITGIDALGEYMKGSKNKWIKTSKYRGDMETFHHLDWAQSESWFNHIGVKLGLYRRDSVKFIIEDDIKGDCEIGADDFCLDGDYPEVCSLGYEVKDKGIISKVYTAKNMPKIITDTEEKVTPILKRYGCQGLYCTELRLLDGKAWYNDPCPRGGSPPSESQCEHISNFTECVWDMSEGRMPTPKYEDEFAAQVILHSEWLKKHSLRVNYPDNIAKWVKLRNVHWDSKGPVCIPQDEIGIVGSVVAVGKSVDKAVELALERVKKVLTYDATYDKTVFDKAREYIERGRKYGINF